MNFEEAKSVVRNIKGLIVSKTKDHVDISVIKLNPEINQYFVMFYNKITSEAVFFSNECTARAAAIQLEKTGSFGLVMGVEEGYA